MTNEVVYITYVHVIRHTFILRDTAITFK